MRRIIPAILLIAVLAIGGGIIASTAYQAGLQTAVATTAAGHRHHRRRPRVRRRLRLAPVRLRLRLLRVPRSPAVLRSSSSGSSGPSSSAAGTATRDGPGWGPGGPMGPGGPDAGRPSGSRYGRWEAVLHQDFDEWHRGAHGPVGDRDRRDRPGCRPDRHDAPGSGRLTSLPRAPGPSARGRIRLPHPTTMPPMRTVLVVDDEARIVQLARDYLEHAGFAVLTAADGPSALETVRRRHPDLVVLDLGLPGLDGLDVTRELRRDSVDPDRDADRPRRRARQAARASSSAPTTT